MQSPDKSFIYEKIVDNLQLVITSGGLKPGEKLQSVRMMSKTLGVSQSTVFRAYYDLEASGLIESRPKSGYYVRYMPLSTALPKPNDFENQAKKITNSEAVREFQASLNQPHVHLNLGIAAPDPSLLPLAKIKKSIQKCYLNDPTASIGYEKVAGNQSLRRQISRFSLAWGKTMTEDEVVITNGCLEAVALSLSVVTQPGDVIAIESPTYYGLLQLIDSLQLKVVEIPGDSETGISMDFMEQVLQTNTLKAILLTSNFNNPNGSIIPDAHKQTLAKWAAEFCVPIIEDDIYGDLYFGENRPKTCKSFDEEGWVIYCSSFSKTLMPGYRIGWCLPGRFKEKYIRKKSVTNIATSSIVQAITNHFLEFGRYEFHLKKLRQALKTQHQQYKRAIYDSFPAKIPCSNPTGGFVLWLELPPNKNALELYRKGLEKGIRIAPGQIFFAKPDITNYFRISYGKPFDDEVKQGIEILGKIASRL